MNTGIVDSHCHIHFGEFEILDVLENARNNGVDQMLTVGVDPSDSLNALGVAKKYEGVWASVGIHPEVASDYGPDDVYALENLAKESEVVAIGETGFDLHCDYPDISAQEEIFKAHIRLAEKMSLPLVIHDRNAHEKTIEVMDEMDAWKVGGVFHCFSGDVNMARYVVDHGFYVSVPGILTFKNSGVLPTVVEDTPVDRLLVETDSPYLAPEPFRGTQNEPARVVYVLKAMAALKGMSEEEMAAETTSNFNRLFFDV